MTYKEFHDKLYNKYHIQFNRQQSAAIHSVNGPVLLLAVPGSGKTTVLVARLGYFKMLSDIFRRTENSYATESDLKGIRGLITYIKNMMLTDEKIRQSENPVPVILSTIHSSKGLEYDHVYLLEVVDGIFPEIVPKNLKTMDKAERETYEEERRLFYVGITRAKRKLSVLSRIRNLLFIRS